MRPTSQTGTESPERLTIYTDPITKTGPIPLELVPQETDQGQEIDRTLDMEGDVYPLEYLELFLGSLAGYALQGKETAMERFVQYLNTLRPGLGTLIWQKFQELREELERYFGVSKIFWFPEISFTPNRSQVEFISAFSKSKVLGAIALENGYKDPKSFIRDLLFSVNSQPNRVVIIDEQTITLAELLSRTNKLQSAGKALEKLKYVESLENKKQLQDQRCTKETTNLKKDLFIRFLKYIVSYYYFNFTGMVKPDDPPLLNERIIASTSARVDLLGFQITNSNDQEAKNLLEEIQSKKILNHLLLDFSTWLTPKNERLITKLLDMINQNRIIIIFTEIKSYFNSNLIASVGNSTNTLAQIDEQALPKTRRRIPGLSPMETQDISHSLLAMFQFLARFTNRPNKNLTGFEELQFLMKSEYKERKHSIRKLIEITKHTEIYLLKITWPIIKEEQDRKDPKKYLNIEQIKNTAPYLEIIPVNTGPNAIILRAILARARRMFEDLFQVNWK